MMQEYLAENARLRQLSKRYAAGELDLADFREARRAILTALEAGISEAQAIDIERRTAGDDPAITLPGEPALNPANDVTVFSRALSPVDLSTPAPAEAEARVAADAFAPEVQNGDVIPATAEAAMDRHTFTLFVILVGAFVIAVGMLVYVLYL